MHIQALEITSPDTHERMRQFALQTVIEFKRARRFELGRAAVVFETRETTLFYVHEVLRADGSWRARDVERVVSELQPLVPQPGQLTATLMIESGDAAYAAAVADCLHGGGPGLALRLGDRYIPAIPADTAVDPLYPLHYVRFEVGPGAARLLLDTRTAARLVLRAGGHVASTSLSWRAREGLADQLLDQYAQVAVEGEATSGSASSSRECSWSTWTS